MRASTARHPLAERQIAPFPRGAMALKTIWAVVHASGLTRLSVWDGPGDPVGANLPAAWPRDSRRRPRRRHAGRGAARPLPSSADRRGGPGGRARDRCRRPGTATMLVLLAVHVTTKEIPDWVWATFWWHDRPDTGPFAAGRPSGAGRPLAQLSDGRRLFAGDAARGGRRAECRLQSLCRDVSRRRPLQLRRLPPGRGLDAVGRAALPAGPPGAARRRRSSVPHAAPGSTSCGRSRPRRASRARQGAPATRHASGRGAAASP